MTTATKPKPATNGKEDTGPDETPAPEVKAPGFTYIPKAGGEPITFPSAAALWETVDGVNPVKFLWRIRRLNEPYQTFAFMERAKVSDEMAERVLDLPDKERKEFFQSWFRSAEEPEVGLPPES